MKSHDEYLRDSMRQHGFDSAPPIYHGRGFFIVAALIMLPTLPYLNRHWSQPFLISILASILMALCAWLTFTTHRWVFVFNALVAGLALLVCEYAAVNVIDTSVPRLIVYQALALLFFCALYCSIKSVRKLKEK